MSSTAETVSLLSSVRRSLDRAGVARGSRVLVAYSGGPDSTVLLWALSALREERALQVAAAYLDHGIRAAAEREAERELVRSTCRKLGVRLTVGAIRPGELGHGAGGSLEAEARRRRYRFLRRAARLSAASVVALGHTADDAAETVLMRIFQGVDISGLGGMPRRRGVFIRPLYHVTRERVVACLREQELLYSTDSTNSSPTHLRNRVRMELLPVVASVFPSYRGSLAELARKARRSYLAIRRAARRRFAWRLAGDAVEGDWGRFAALDGVLRLAAVYQGIDRLSALGADARIPYRMLEPVFRLRGDERDGVLLSGRGIRLSRRREAVRLETDVVRPVDFGYLIRVRGNGEYTLPEHGIIVEVATSGSMSAQRALDTEPLVVRTCKSGDRIRLREGWRSVGEMTRAWRARPAPEFRDAVTLLADRGGVVRILGPRAAIRTRADEPGESGREPGVDVSVRQARVEEQ